MKKLLASMIGLSILITTFGVTVNAVNTRNLLDSVPRVIISSYEITNDDIDEIIPLYNFDESIIAYCLIYKDNGYIIYDNNGNMIVRSDEGKPLFYQINKPIYITGPTGYYYKDKNSFINILNSNIILNEGDQRLNSNAILMLSEVQVNSNDSSIQPLAVTQKTISYVPRLYSYNPTGICMGTATATILAYYDDHINGNTAPQRHLADGGVGLTTLLAADLYYKYDGVGASIRDTLNWYFKTHSFGNAASYTSSYYDGAASNVYSKVVSRINAYRPIVVSYNDGAGTNHCVCAYGYKTDSSNFNNSQFVCSNGWGGTMWVSARYLYSSAWINA